MAAVESIVPFIAAGAALAVGLLLLAKPSVAGRLNRPLREALPGIRLTVRVERSFYRHHLLTGPLTAAGGAFLLYKAWTYHRLSTAAAADGLGAVVLDGLPLIFLLAGLAIVALGSVVTFRPSALRRFESWANRPITREDLIDPPRRARRQLLSFTGARPRTVGALLAAGGLALLLLAAR